MGLYLYFKKLKVSGEKEIAKYSSGKFIIEFRTNTFMTFFVFDVAAYIISFCMSLVVLCFYYKDIKLYSIVKNIIIVKVEELDGEILKNLLEFEHLKGLIVIIIIVGLLIMLRLIYKRKTKEEFKFGLRTMIYYRVNFLINYYVFITIFKIDTKIFIEYNFIIIIIFIMYFIIQIICVILQKEIKFKLLHYLNGPGISLCFWLYLSRNISNLEIFENLYNEFMGYDEKYYDAASVNVVNLLKDIKKKDSKDLKDLKS